MQRARDLCAEGNAGKLKSMKKKPAFKRAMARCGVDDEWIKPREREYFREKMADSNRALRMRHDLYEKRRVENIALVLGDVDQATRELREQRRNTMRTATMYQEGLMDAVSIEKRRLQRAEERLKRWKSLVETQNKAIVDRREKLSRLTAKEERIEANRQKMEVGRRAFLESRKQMREEHGQRVRQRRNTLEARRSAAQAQKHDEVTKRAETKRASLLDRRVAEAEQVRKQQEARKAKAIDRQDKMKAEAMEKMKAAEERVAARRRAKQERTEERMERMWLLRHERAQNAERLRRQQDYTARQEAERVKAKFEKIEELRKAAVAKRQARQEFHKQDRIRRDTWKKSRGTLERERTPGPTAHMPATGAAWLSLRDLERANRLKKALKPVQRLHSPTRRGNTSSRGSVSSHGSSVATADLAEVLSQEAQATMARLLGHVGVAAGQADPTGASRPSANGSAGVGTLISPLRPGSNLRPSTGDGGPRQGRDPPVGGADDRPSTSGSPANHRRTAGSPRRVSLSPLGSLSSRTLPRALEAQAHARLRSAVLIVLGRREVEAIEEARGDDAPPVNLEGEDEDLLQPHTMAGAVLRRSKHLGASTPGSGGGRSPLASPASPMATLFGQPSAGTALERGQMQAALRAARCIVQADHAIVEGDAAAATSFVEGARRAVRNSVHMSAGAGSTAGLVMDSAASTVAAEVAVNIGAPAEAMNAMLPPAATKVPQALVKDSKARIAETQRFLSGAVAEEPAGSMSARGSSPRRRLGDGSSASPLRRAVSMTPQQAAAIDQQLSLPPVVGTGSSVLAEDSAEAGPESPADN